MWRMKMQRLCGDSIEGKPEYDREELYFEASNIEQHKGNKELKINQTV